MSGTDIIGELLRGSDPLLAVVQVANMKAGALPENATLPALLLRSISSVDRQPLKRGSVVRVTERVSVTVRAASYRDQKMVMKLVRSACAGVIAASIGDAQRVSVLTAGKGPDLAGPAASFEQAQDFRVSFDEPA